MVGILLIIPIGGAGIPVVISMLNFILVAAGMGFTLENTALIITKHIAIYNTFLCYAE